MELIFKRERYGTVCNKAYRAHAEFVYMLGKESFAEHGEKLQRYR